MQPYLFSFDKSQSPPVPTTLLEAVNAESHRYNKSWCGELLLSKLWCTDGHLLHHNWVTHSHSKLMLHFEQESVQVAVKACILGTINASAMHVGFTASTA